MNKDLDIYYKAYAARDARFDGVFYIGVTSTGIYCRPICKAKMPKRENCRFFKSPEAAEKEFFRPCLRCRPERAPRNPHADHVHRIANWIIEEEYLDEKTCLEEVAQEFGLSSRQMRRIIQTEFGLPPIALLLTRRLWLARQLLTETHLSIIEIAFASGFSSLRRFNDAFKKHYKMPPSYIRKPQIHQTLSSEKITLHLHYRPPFNWVTLLNFLQNRMIEGVESIEEGHYSRTVQISKHKGWIRVSNVQENHALKVEISLSLTPVLAILLTRIRHLFDLNARPDLITAHLSQDPLLAADVLKNPGLRVPGAFDGFEISLRAILGQQITVKAATTLASRLVKTFGETIETPFPQLHYLFPTAQSIISVPTEKIAALGIIRSRAQSILALADEISSQRLQLNGHADPEKTINQLISIPGIGKWTAHYIAMRALRWPDAFPKEDTVLRKRLGGVSAKQADMLSQAWRPWRSYATLYLWSKTST
ncbi:MAG: adenosine deaminase [Chlamydiales bacterium 38-26]|nr:helix-turn-helix domain-containing protein [Chlamydiales bacterium]OJV08123.1 MAG: adenosine deaminase [Chlamydiales bacterium 38-26]